MFVINYLATHLFTNKANVYKKARPNYPVQAVEYIFDNLNILKPTAIDIGAGPGKFTQLLLNRCDFVYAVEPNEPMRNQLKNYLGSNKKFKAKLKIIDSYAEKLDLSNEIADLITVAHAFHWFDEIKCKEEFKRVLKKDGRVALLWNIYTDVPAMQQYDNIIHQKCAIKEALFLKEKEIEKNLDNFFINYEKKIFPHAKFFDFSNILNLSESAHCTPIKNEQGYDFMVRQLTKWFDKYKYNGKVEFSYNCILFLGNI